MQCLYIYVLVSCDVLCSTESPLIIRPAFLSLEPELEQIKFLPSPTATQPTPLPTAAPADPTGLSGLSDSSEPAAEEKDNKSLGSERKSEHLDPDVALGEESEGQAGSVYTDVECKAYYFI